MIFIYTWIKSDLIIEQFSLLTHLLLSSYFNHVKLVILWYASLHLYSHMIKMHFVQLSIRYNVSHLWQILIFLQISFLKSKIHPGAGGYQGRGHWGIPLYQLSLISMETIPRWMPSIYLPILDKIPVIILKIPTRIMWSVAVVQEVAHKKNLH